MKKQNKNISCEKSSCTTGFSSSFKIVSSAFSDVYRGGAHVMRTALSVSLLLTATAGFFVVYFHGLIIHAFRGEAIESSDFFVDAAAIGIFLVLALVVYFVLNAFCTASWIRHQMGQSDFNHVGDIFKNMGKSFNYIVATCILTCVASLFTAIHFIGFFFHFLILTRFIFWPLYGALGEKLSLKQSWEETSSIWMTNLKAIVLYNLFAWIIYAFAFLAWAGITVLIGDKSIYLVPILQTFTVSFLFVTLGMTWGGVMTKLYKSRPEGAGGCA